MAERITLDIEDVAHGGHCIGRHDGRVVFVRHSLPGERVVAEVTSTGGGGRFLRADAIDVLTASPDRIEPRCPLSGPGGCGGCDWQHATPESQRRMKAEVVTAALSRVGVATTATSAEAIEGDHDGLGWRSRVRWTVDDHGRLGLHRHRSNDVIPVEHCPLVTDAVNASGATGRTWDCSSVFVTASSTGEVVVLEDGQPDARVHESAAGRRWTVGARGFWQVHPGAAETLAGIVRGWAGLRPGQTVVDLYSGVGLFAGTIADDVGPEGRVHAVESSADACRNARRNLHDLPWVTIHNESATKAPVERADVVIVDPPRTGARDAVPSITAMDPSTIVMVSCEPSTLARDLSDLRSAGYEPGTTRILDLFPTTHHVETVTVLHRT